MASNTIDAGMLAKMFLAGAKNLESKKEWINELNVFPVPDGDTGTNMTLTIMSAAREVVSLNNTGAIDMRSLCKAISSGSLRGARGNSGVILSQLFRGFTKGVKECDEITIPVLAAALEKAVETAYKAVMKPKEGTILTVAKGAAIKARELVDNGMGDMAEFLAQIIARADEVLEQTPEMLPVLKQAGVVDSGGQGLMQVLKGAYDAFLGKEIDLSLDTVSTTSVTGRTSGGNLEAQANAEIKFGYCTEFIIMLNKVFNIKMEMDFKAYLESIGDSIVVVADEDVVKVHVHTNDPGLAMQKGLTYGSLTTIIIENMKLERDEKISAMKEKEMQGESASAPLQEAKKEPEKEMGFVAVSIGEGLNEIFRGLGADYIIEGGQTMNPSTEDILKAVDMVNAKTVFIFPNNKNIILAANQAVSLCEDKNIIVIPTTTIPQGITALINYMPDQTPKENADHMNAEIARIKTGQVTYAVRDTEIDDKEIHQGDYMGIGDKTILSVGTDRRAVTLDLIEQLIDEESSLLSIYYGKEAEQMEAEEFSKLIMAKHPELEVEINSGGQPVYYYIVSVE